MGQRQEADQAKHANISPEMGSASPAPGWLPAPDDLPRGTPCPYRPYPYRVIVREGRRGSLRAYTPAPAGARAAHPSSQRALASNSSSTMELDVGEAGRRRRQGVEGASLVDRLGPGRRKPCTASSCTLTLVRLIAASWEGRSPT